jgi:hypothetical protein
MAPDYSLALLRQTRKKPLLEKAAQKFLLRWATGNISANAQGPD